MSIHTTIQPKQPSNNNTTAFEPQGGFPEQTDGGGYTVGAKNSFSIQPIQPGVTYGKR